MTVEKKTSGSASMTPSATPVALLKVRILPLTKITNCDGPAAPIESGGNECVSTGPVTLSHCKPMVWEKFGPVIESALDVSVLLLEAGGNWASNRDAGFWRRCARLGIMNSRLTKLFFFGPVAACSVMMSAIVRLIPFSPATGAPTVTELLLPAGLPKPSTPRTMVRATNAGTKTRRASIEFGRGIGYRVILERAALYGGSGSGA